MKKTIISDMQTFILENKFLFISVIPEAGSKIFNFIFKPSGNNCAWHSPITPLKCPIYGSSFIPYDSGGFDEMLPTVEECTWRGIHLHDHGEVWMMPWKVLEKKSNEKEVSLKTSCRLKTSPFSIERKVTLKELESRVRLDYKITNVCKEEWEFIWAFHGSVSPGGFIGKGTKIFLPEETRLNVWDSKEERLGKMGDWIEWPLTKDKDEKEVDLSLMEDANLGFADDIFTDKLKEGWVAAGNIENEEYIAFTFPINEIPYVGLWIDQGGWRGYTQLGLEPTNTAGASLDVAVSDYLQKYDKLHGGESKEFTMYISVIKGLKDIKKVTKEGCYIEIPLVYEKGKLKGKFGVPLLGKLVLKEKIKDNEILRINCIPYEPVEFHAQIKNPGIYEVELLDKENNLFEQIDEIEVKSSEL